jgi:acyl-CoA thioester hydrolase
MTDAPHVPLGEFPVVIEVPVAWGEMDAFGHVNNAVYFRWFESARMAYLARIGYDRPDALEGLGPILASTSCRFRIALDYPDTVRVGARVAEVLADRFRMVYSAVSERHGKVAAEAEGWIVSYDYRERRKAPLPESIRQAIADLEE